MILSGDEAHGEHRLTRPSRSLLLTLLLLAGCPEGLGPFGPGGPGDPPDAAADDSVQPGDDDIGEEPGVRAVEILDNPNSTLSCYVRWQTAQPTDSRVTFGVTPDYDFFVEDAELVTEHELLVFGMRANTTYHLQIVSATQDGETHQSDILTYETGELPFPDLRTEVDIHDPDAAQDGWTLANVVVWDALCPTIAVIFDMEGYPIWYYEMGAVDGSADVVVRMLDDGHILIGGGIPVGGHPVEVDMAGEIWWEGPEQVASFGVSGNMHHTFESLPNGDYDTLVFDFVDGRLFDIITQFDASGTHVWTWRTEDHLPCESEFGQKGNKTSIDLDDRAAYYHHADNGLLYKIDYDTSEILWSLGENGDFVMLTEHDEPWFMQAHDPEILGNGNLLAYDNGSGERDYSRVVEYALDEASLTAELVWEYPGQLGDDVWVASALGDADRLDNGNTLITVGSFRAGESPNRIFEVTAEGTIVWQMRQWAQSGEGNGESVGFAGAYASERIPVGVGVL
jgi:hypothetical protein